MRTLADVFVAVRFGPVAKRSRTAPVAVRSGSVVLALETDSASSILRLFVVRLIELTLPRMQITVAA